MQIFGDNPLRRVLITLFYLFEVLLVASAIVACFTDPREIGSVNDAAGIAFGFSFVGLFIVCLFLIRIDRGLARRGWFTLFAWIILSGFLFPAVA